MGWNSNRYYNRYNKYDRKAARLGETVCSLMFVTFAAVYLAVFQKDLLEAIHFSMSEGRSEFEVVPATIVIIVILMILKLALNLLLRLRGRVNALAYLPSFMGLVTLTGFGRDVYMGDFYHAWWWMMPVLTVGFTLAVLAAKKLRTGTDRKCSMMGTAIWNVMLMTLMGTATVCLGNSDRYFHNELRMESLMAKGKNLEATKVAGKSLRTTRTMTALRMIAMTKAGKTADMVFGFPQYYKEDGMFFDTDSTKTLRYTNDSIYAMLGGKPEPGEKRMDYMKRMAEGTDSCGYARTYYMTGLMLDKNLEGLAQAMRRWDLKGDTTGRYLKEAAILYKAMNPEWDFKIEDKDSVCHRERERYLEMKMKGFDSENQERNIMRREFGDTFWWYYDYQQ